jgi:hypothetical protein
MAQDFIRTLPKGETFVGFIGKQLSRKGFSFPPGGLVELLKEMGIPLRRNKDKAIVADLPGSGAGGAR